jgi:excisionase family DNA binding protein
MWPQIPQISECYLVWYAAMSCGMMNTIAETQYKGGFRMAKMAENDDRLVLAVPEAARALGVNPRTVYRLVEQGAIPFIKLGTRIAIPRRELEQWIAEQAAASVAQEPQRLGRVG